ncbi:hypothetical protein C0993_006960 [Termitomyces sp. T159_Od127]|nr:hypothetical protein C0993_006960 [Termitomyces sp. T159_Od127]
MAPLDHSASASSSSASSASSSPARRIRFAPLPDPRALDDDDRAADRKPCALDAAPAPAPPPAPPAVSRPRSLSLLRAFRRSPSSASLTPTPSEEIVTLGTINLFRPASKSPDDPAPSAASSGWRFRLTRFSSPALPPLARTQSAQPHAQLAVPNIRQGPAGGRTPRRPVSLDAKAPSSPLRFGTRMLNGRVYGARKHAPNPFASAPDDDPEFVEWGHGGMGSVRGAEHAGIAAHGPGPARPQWERLQSAGAPDEDECDGSGMGWVKKRKEAREREARERAEREKAEIEALQPAATAATPDPPVEHNLTTVNVPHHARHRHPSSRATSAEGVPTLASTAPRPSSETESETESESNPDEEDEDDEELQRRLTALGAGVEKVSRHHD